MELVDQVMLYTRKRNFGRREAKEVDLG